MSLKKVLVTGCTGLVGDGLARYFRSQGCTVVGTCRKDSKLQHDRGEIIHLELTDPDSFDALLPVLADTDLVIHSAADLTRQKDLPLEQSLRVLEANILGTYRLLRLIETRPGLRMIYISRCPDFLPGEFEEDVPYHTTDEYSTSKLCGELLCQQFNLTARVPTLIFRICSPYGYIFNDAVISRFIRQVRKGEDIMLWGSGSRQQIFTFVEDIAYACELGFHKQATGVFNITGGDPVSMKSLAELIKSLYPKSISKIVLSGQSDPQEGRVRRISLDKAKKELGYSPRYDLAGGLAKIIDQLNGLHQENVSQQNRL